MNMGMSIIEPTGHGDLLSPHGHRHVGVADDIARIRGEVVTYNGDGSHDTNDEDGVDADDVDWGMGWLNDFPCHGCCSRAAEGFVHRTSPNDLLQ